MSMIELIQFFRQYSILIYLFLAIGILFSLRSISRARKNISSSIFGLERETSRRSLIQGISAICLLSFLALAELVIVVFLYPKSPAMAFIQTRTINPLNTRTATIPPEILEQLGGTSQVPEQTLQATGCIPGQIMITEPRPGDLISGVVKITGSATIPNFGFYKYEFSPSGMEAWITILADREVKQDSELGFWDTRETIPGNYDLRMVIIDNQGNVLPACVIPVSIAVQ